MREGFDEFHKGGSGKAVTLWEEAAKLFGAAGRLSEESKAQSQIAKAYKALGQNGKSLERYKSAMAMAEKTGDKAHIALVMAGLGDAYSINGSPEIARSYLDKSLALARGSDEPGVTAAVQNYLGYLLQSQKKYSDAEKAFSLSLRQALEAGDRFLTAEASINIATVSFLDRRYAEARKLAGRAANALRKLDDSREKSFGLIDIGQLYRRLAGHFPDSDSRLLIDAQRAFSEAAGAAEKIGDRRAVSFAYGYMGQLYESEERYLEALRLTRKAIFAAQQVEAPETLYIWQWQSGRLFRARDDIEEAISSYRRAVDTLQSIRHELSGCHGAARGSFRQTAGPVFFELVDLLLQRAASIKDERLIERYLIEARETSEMLKEAELQDYFQDECVSAIKAKAASVERISPNTAIVYVVILPDRIELLLSLPAGLKRFTSRVGADTLTAEVRKFRVWLEKRTTREYMPHAQKLYDWLIRPIEKELETQKIDTLVFVPEASLRTIPMAALHDGRRFLITKYAIATTPGLNLIDPRPIKRENVKVLLTGLTESVQGFPPLAFVADELEGIRNLYGGASLLNRSFLISNMEKELKDEHFSIVHIASHGKFEGEVEKSFLLTFNEKLTMNRLEQLMGSSQFRDKPVELLILSACQTAAGDDRAALGLAGVAIKAGARSALASLWFINDRATSMLIEEFYRQFQDPSVSKAKALQKAQLKILDERRYRHPGYWSPFLLIGNWL